MRITLLFGTLLCSAALATAGLITADPGTGVTTTFTDTGNNGFGNPGPIVLDGFTVTGSLQVTFGNATYGFGTLGSWSSFPWIATNDGSNSITFNLGGSYGLVGGFMNYSPGSGSDATIDALAANGTTVLETYDLVTQAAINTGGAGNSGAFRGFSRGTNDIAFLRISGDFIGMHTLEIGSPAAAVPEPPTFGLAGFALLGVGLIRRRASRVS